MITPRRTNSPGAKAKVGSVRTSSITRTKVATVVPQEDPGPAQAQQTAEAVWRQSEQAHLQATGSPSVAGMLATPTLSEVSDVGFAGNGNLNVSGDGTPSQIGDDVLASLPPTVDTVYGAAQEVSMF